MKKTVFTVIFSLLAFAAFSQLADIEGDYVVQERNYLKQGSLIRYPYNGENVVYEIRLTSGSDAIMKQTVYRKGKLDFQQSIKIKVEQKKDRVEFVEIWESGAWELNGYISGNQLIVNNKERLTNYLLLKEIAVK